MFVLRVIQAFVSPGYRGLSALGAAGSDSDYRALWWWFSGRMYRVAAG
jgi:hypothetical protein